MEHLLCLDVRLVLKHKSGIVQAEAYVQILRKWWRGLIEVEIKHNLHQMIILAGPVTTSITVLSCLCAQQLLGPYLLNKQLLQRKSWDVSLVSINLSPSYLQQLQQCRAQRGFTVHGDTHSTQPLLSELCVCVCSGTICFPQYPQSTPFSCIQEQGHASEGWRSVDEEVHWLSEVLLPALSTAVMNMHSDLLGTVPLHL